MARTIFHVDMDAFYASVELRERPELRGKPVIVGADPKGGEGRGVVVSCSYEARKLGVRTAMPISLAYTLCPDEVYLRPNFPLYERASANVMRVLRRFADRFEQVSIDEAFLDVSEKVRGYGSSEALARRIKDEVLRREGLTCSIGVAPNKSVAKIASDFKKPDGLTIVELQDIRSFLAPLPVLRISGIGKKTQAKLAGMGIESISQLADYPREELVKHFGKNGLWMSDVANGIDDSPVEESWMARSISSETTFEEDTNDVKTIYNTISGLVDDVHRRLLIKNYLYRTVVVKIRFEDFETLTRSKSLKEYTSSRDIIQDYSKQLVEQFLAGDRRIRLIGVRVANLTKALGVQRTLLAWAEPQRTEASTSP